MKKRRNLILSFVIVALLLVGIGYAAVLSDELTIDGSAAAEANAADFNVDWVSGDGYTVNDDTATVTVTGMTTADSSKVKTINLKVKNNSEALTAVLGAWGTVTNNNPDYFTVSVAWAQDAPTELAPGQEASVVLTITLIKDVADTASAEFDVTFTATAKAA